MTPKHTKLAIAGLALVSIAAMVIGNTTNQPSNAPIKLQSVATNKPATPVMVLHDIVVVTTPQGQIIWCDEHQMAQLAKLFPVGRVTNLIIYAP